MVCLQNDHEISFLEPKLQPVIGLSSLLRNTKLNEKKIGNKSKTFMFSYCKSDINRFAFTLQKLPYSFVFSVKS